MVVAFLCHMLAGSVQVSIMLYDDCELWYRSKTMSNLLMIDSHA